MTVEAPAGSGCEDDTCDHTGHCGVAHDRKAHTLARIMTGQKMDAPGMLRGACSCGNYRTAVGTRAMVIRAHGHHQAAKLAAIAKELPCVHCPPEVLAASFARRAAAEAVAQP